MSSEMAKTQRGIMKIMETKYHKKLKRKIAQKLNQFSRELKRLGRRIKFF
jgi:hypothetical protein